MRVVLTTIAALCLAACTDGEHGESIDIESMNEAALGPVVPITLDPIGFAEIEKYDLFGNGCNMMAEDEEGLLFIAGSESAAFILEGELITAASDAGSQELPYGARSRYSGTHYAINLKVLSERPESSGYEAAYYPGVLEIIDAQGRTVYSNRGTVQCGA